MLNSRLVLPRPILLVLAALGLLFAIDLFALAAYRELEHASEKLNQHVLTTEALQLLPMLLLEMQSGVRSYVLTGSTASLNRYRAAANEFKGAAEKALALLGEDPRQRQLVEGGVVSVRDWLARHASPLVVKRSAGEDPRRTTMEILDIMRNGQGESQAGRIRARFVESIQIERERVADARLSLEKKHDRIAAWMRGRALALLLALAALTLMLGRTLANLTGHMRSREIAESATRTSAATLRAMTDASPLGMFLADGSGACVQWNPAFERITGLSAPAILGNGWQSTLHTDDREKVVAAWSAATATGTTFASVHRFVHRSGKVVWASMKSASMSDGGQLIGFACSIEDVSERRDGEEALRKTEERLHLALESSGLALFDWHVPSGEIFLSREWNTLIGNAAQALTTTARRLNEKVHPEDREALREAIVGGFKTNNPIPRTQFRIDTRAGQWKRVSCSGRVTERDSSGRAVRLTGTITASD
ncbi:MAG: PAS domain-containing protein [Prolixibacteraceae bacterium]|nr:PAS domain-containing protein [Burkholderiales bacterium]